MADEPTLGELSRQIASLSSRFDRYDASLDKLLRVDVYMADQRAVNADLLRLQTEVTKLEAEADAREAAREKERGEWKRSKYSGWVGAIVASVIGVLGPIIVVALLK